jgi:hypothetical protein
MRIDQQCCGQVVGPISRLSRQGFHRGEKIVERLLRVPLRQTNRSIGICRPHQRHSRLHQGRKRDVQHLRACTIVAVQVGLEATMNHHIPFMHPMTPLVTRLLVPSGNDQCEVTVLMSMPRQHGVGTAVLAAKERGAEATHFQRLYDEPCPPITPDPSGFSFTRHQGGFPSWEKGEGSKERPVFRSTTKRNRAPRRRKRRQKSSR